MLKRVWRKGSPLTLLVEMQTSTATMAPHCSTLAWKIPWMEEPGGLQSMGFSRQEYWSGLPLPSPLFALKYIYLNFFSLTLSFRPKAPLVGTRSLSHLHVLYHLYLVWMWRFGQTDKAWEKQEQLGCLVSWLSVKTQPIHCSHLKNSGTVALDTTEAT